MALLYNQDTAVSRPTDQILKEQTDYLNEYNIVGRETDKQTQIITFRYSSDPTTFTLSADVILTGVWACIQQTTSSGGHITITAGGQVILDFTCNTSPAGGNNQTYTTFSHLPNYLIKKGEQIILDRIGASGGVDGIVYAYYA